MKETSTGRARIAVYCQATRKVSGKGMASRGAVVEVIEHCSIQGKELCGKRFIVSEACNKWLFLGSEVIID